MSGQPGRFEVGAAVAAATALGLVTFTLAGLAVWATLMWIAPVLVPVLLGAGALGGVWLIVRGSRTAKGFGLGLVLGWVLLAVWTSGWT